MLAIQKYIIQHGLEKTVQDFSLILKDYDHKILLKYDQIESNFAHQEVRDCRGLILKKSDWSVMSLGFRKFFNYGEGYAAILDYNTTDVYEKKDGTFIQLYYDDILNSWEVGTTGTANGHGEVNNKPNLHFYQLFWDTITKNSKSTKEEIISKLLPGLVYMFELCSIYNIVVVQHTYQHVTLLAIRDVYYMYEYKRSLVEEVAKYLNVEIVKKYSLSADVPKLIEYLSTQPYTDEGYVLCDVDFNRLKIKNPAYLAVHYIKEKNAHWRIIDVIKSNEVEEFVATFIDRKEELYTLLDNYTNLSNNLENCALNLSIYKDRKEYAIQSLEVCQKLNIKQFQSFMFNKFIDSTITAKDFLKNYDSKKLYKYLTE